MHKEEKGEGAKSRWHPLSPGLIIFGIHSVVPDCVYLLLSTPRGRLYGSWRSESDGGTRDYADYVAGCKETDDLPPKSDPPLPK